MYRWISLYWVWLLPLLATLGTLVRLRAAWLARRRGLISLLGWRWMLMALIAAQAVIWLTQAALVYPTSAWLTSAGLAAIGLSLTALYFARPSIHPGLRGLLRPVPLDGLALLMPELHPRRRTLTRWLPLLPPLILLAYIASAQPDRWFDYSLFAVTLAAPFLSIPFRGYWLLPTLLIAPVSVLFAQALLRQPTLPSGAWSTPISGADCTGQLRLSPPWAWCVNVFTNTVYQFDLRTGVVAVETHVSESAHVFAANDNFGWIQQSPSRGLVVVEAATGQATPMPVLSAHFGAAEAANRLWIIDVSHELWLHSGGTKRTLRSGDGLLNNTAYTVKVSPEGDVWIGSIEGVSWLRTGETQWQTLARTGGMPGAVRNIAFTPKPRGVVWLLWQARNLGSWGVVALAPSGEVSLSFNIGSETGLEFPVAEDALAVDGLGRVWFVTQSITRREKILGIFTPSVGLDVELYSLGPFSSGGPYGYGGSLWQDSVGVLADGAGGIILFNGDQEPWRRWQP